MDEKSNNVEIGTVEIENSCAKLSLTGAFDFPEQIISYADLDKQERGKHESHTHLTRHSSSSYPCLYFKENHFSSPEVLEKSSKISVLQSAIEEYTEQIKVCTSKHDKSRLVKKLVELRFELLNLKDDNVDSEDNLKCLMGHSFEERPWGRAKGYCERCCSVIIGILQSWYKCKKCNFCCHKKCIDNITRICASYKIKQHPMLKLKICPEVGLHTQQYSCYECKSPIGFQPGTEEARQCDYTGAFYCNKCHWNDAVVIPSRVVANWDFEPRKVCRATKSLLKLMSHRAILNIQRLNPMLFTYIDELSEIRKRRNEILIMKKVFLECQDAMREKFLLKLKHRQHFVENSDVYSMQDLIDAHQDVLLPELTKIHALFAQHIKSDCNFCKEKGMACKICKSDEILYQFDSTAHVCPTCSSIVHIHCFQVKNQKCPQCST